MEKKDENQAAALERGGGFSLEDGRGLVWVCPMCGKTNTNKDRWTMPGNGWDESCAMKAVLCFDGSIRYDESGKVTSATAAEEVEVP